MEGENQVIYEVMNPYGQPKGQPVLTGVRRPELDRVVDRNWYEGELIPEELLSPIQKEYFTSRGVIRPTDEAPSVQPTLEMKKGKLWESTDGT